MGGSFESGRWFAPIGGQGIRCALFGEEFFVGFAYPGVVDGVVEVYGTAPGSAVRGVVFYGWSVGCVLRLGHVAGLGEAEAGGVCP